MPDIRHLGRMATITAATVGTVLALGLSTAAAATRTTGNDPDGWYRFAVSRQARPESSAVSPTA